MKQNCNLALLTIDGVVSRSEVSWYVGKRVCFPYKARTEKNGTRQRAIWGKVKQLVKDGDARGVGRLWAHMVILEQ